MRAATNTMQQQVLTAVQTRVLEFIRREIRSTGRSPSMREIQEEFGYGSPHTPQFHVDKLVKGGHLRRKAGHRGLQLPESQGLRLLGTVAAGPPIEAIEEQGEHLDVNGFSDDNHFALRVRGDSMIEECIADGDHVIVRKQSTCEDGDLVVARIGDDATLKRFYRERGKRRIRLQPANSGMQPIFCKANDVVIEGVVVGVIRLMA
jgi:repressor LexA